MIALWTASGLKKKKKLNSDQSDELMASPTQKYKIVI